MHALTGVDHILAIVAIGVLAVNVGGRAVWTVPISFMAAMTVGAALGMTGASLPSVEIVIALSVVVLGLAVAVGNQPSLLVAAIVAGAFGLFHGHSHGSEFAESTGALRSTAGLLLATGLLHLIGIGVGWGIKGLSPRLALRVRRLAGFATATIGVTLIIGHLLHFG